MNHSRLFLDKKSLVSWLIFGFGIVTIVLSFVPLDVLIRFGGWIVPAGGSVQDKTILLFQALKYVLPVIGLSGLVWLFVPGRARQVLLDPYGRLVASRLSPVAILFLACLLRFAWIAFFPTNLYADSIWYFEKGTELAKGLGYVFDTATSKPTAYWPIGYPLFLAFSFLLTGPNLFVAKFANVMLSVLAVALTFGIARLIFNRVTALGSAFILAILPGYVVYASLVASEPLFLTSTLAVFWLILFESKLEERLSKLPSVSLVVAIGIICGIAALIRSVGLGLFPFWILTRWVYARHLHDTWLSVWAWAALLGIGLGVVLLPWTLRNYNYFHRLIPVSTNGGKNFWMGNNPLAYGGWFFPRDESQNPLLPFNNEEDILDQMGYRFGLEFIKQNPLQAIRLSTAKIFLMYNSNDFGLYWNSRSSPGNNVGTGIVVQMLTNLAYTLVCFFAILGLITFLFVRPRPRYSVWLGAAFISYLALLHLPFFGQDRFALPALPFVAMYATSWLTAILEVKA